MLQSADAHNSATRSRGVADHCCWILSVGQQQVGDARYVFEAKTIQRMELLVLSTLKWRMQAVTPFSYIDYFLHRLTGGGDAPSRRAVLRSAELILRIARGEH